MIAGIFHKGSGLGNQLHRYVMTRVLALDKGYDFSMVAPELFKGKDFMKLDMGKDSKLSYRTEVSSGKVICINKDLKLWEERGNQFYNPEINFVEDYSIIDGEFQDERYFGHRLKEIDEWLQVDHMDIDDDTCVINFRGGEYTMFPELFLTQDYWDIAIKMMKDKGIEHFIVATDDVQTAKTFFPDYDCIHNVGENWRMIRYAKHLILSNSSFAILPALLNLTKDIIAPKGWAKHNSFNGQWGTNQNYYSKFRYI